MAKGPLPARTAASPAPDPHPTASLSPRSLPKRPRLQIRPCRGQGLPTWRLERAHPSPEQQLCESHLTGRLCVAARTVRPRQICRVGAFRSGLGAKPLSADLRTRDQRLQELCCASEMCAWSQGRSPASYRWCVSGPGVTVSRA